MAELSTLARPYAKAVFELARDEGKLAEWSALLAGLARAVRDPQVARAIGHPAIGRGALADVLVQAAGAAASAQAKNLLKLLAEYDRLKLAGEIALQFEALRAEAEKRIDVQIATAAAVEPAQQQALVAAVKKKLSRDVNVTWTTDPSLIAGAQIRAGDTSGTEALLRAAYDELRRLAADKLARERGGQTLQATALVHEAWLRLTGGDPTPQWNSRGHFFGAAAEAMRRILVENARRKQRLRHGGGRQRVDLDSQCAIAGDGPGVDILALDEALVKLAASDAAKAEVVKLRFFAGLTMPEVATALDISLATAERHWTFARSWLYAELADHT